MNDRASLTVFFEDPFWVGVFERVYDNKLQVCKYTFYKEPTDLEIFNFIYENYAFLEFSSPIEIEDRKKNKIKKYKRKIREAKTSMTNFNIGTKAQNAIKIQQEEKKLENKCKAKKQKELKSIYLFNLKREKHKQKHRGH